MKIVFYSSNSNIFDKENFFITTLPSHFQKWKEFIKNHPEDEFYFVTEQPGMFILDLPPQNQIDYKLLENENIFIESSENIDSFVNKILSFEPDIAISMSFWVAPFDWLGIQDSLIAEKLNEHGIKSICHSAQLNYNFFDKYKTKQLLEKNNFNTPKGIYVNHDMYFCAGNRKEIKRNVYKDYILNQVRKLQFPLIAKDPFGLSSYGMQVLNSYGEVCNYLNSKKNNSDRIIEEMIDGEQFGIEFYCNSNFQNAEQNLSIFPPFIFSVNKYGITSPKQSIKIGPVFNKKYNIEELYKNIKKLTEIFKFNGIAQMDLVFNNGKWYIIEINPRLSGMSLTDAALMNDFNNNLFEMIFFHFVLTKNLFYKNTNNNFINNNQNFEKCINIKFPILTEEQLYKIKNFSFVKYVCQTENKAALQEREKGFCEVIICAETFEKLLENLLKIEKDFPNLIEKSFFENAKTIINNLQN